MSEAQAFHDAMAANPYDRHSRSVYADWLEEHGNPQAAQRLRWWTRAMAYLENPTEAPREHDTALPHWAQRLAAAYRAHKGLDSLSASKVRWKPIVRGALASAERDAIGVEPFNEQDKWIDRLVRLTNNARWDAAVAGGPERVLFAARHIVGATHPNMQVHPNSHTGVLRSANEWLTGSAATPFWAAIPHVPETEQHVRNYAERDPEDVTKLAAIPPPDSSGSVLVRVPVPTAVPNRTQPAQQPQQPAKPAAPKGPTFFLPG